MARLAGKVAFITGGGGGIGRATAERFAEEGAKVVIAEIDKERGEAAAQSARALARNSGGDAHFIHCDIRDKANVEAAFAQTVERFGKLTILHNNAGGSTPQDGPVTDAPEEEFWRVINLDLYGTFLCSKIGIPHIIKAGGGAIINMRPFWWIRRGDASSDSVRRSGRLIPRERAMGTFTTASRPPALLLRGSPAI